MLAIAAAMLLGALFRMRKGRLAPLDRKELARYRRASEQASREWMYPFE